MAATTNIVNLDALIRRADLATPGESSEDINALSVMGLAPKGLLYPALRKPDFQRETASWGPEQVADLISTFARRDLIPAVILWRAGHTVFVIDGAHRLSALIAWVHDDYGDGDVSRRFFQNYIPEEQSKAANRARDLVNAEVGSFRDHQFAIDFPDRSRPDIAERAARIGWQEIPAQWIRNADHDKAEKSFFRINQGGTKIDPTERRILNARGSATALAARAILRSGTGHNYWKSFEVENREKIEELGGQIYKLLFEPGLELPVRTLDVPLAGQGYGPHVLPFLFDLVNLTNDVAVKDSSYKRSGDDEGMIKDEDGGKTIEYLIKTRSILWRICSNHASSLGLHPALYFYSHGGVFQTTALLSIIHLFKGFQTADFIHFAQIRGKFEEFLMVHRSITEAVRKLGSGARSRPRVVSMFRELMDQFLQGNSVHEVTQALLADDNYAFLFKDAGDVEPSSPGRKFSRETKGAAFLRDALPTAPRCPTCGGIMHRNGMQAGHVKAKRDGGTGDVSNAMMQHPFCNSTVAQ
ncbi:DUF262 domain-containing protein [Skermanella sp. TT6]|uniref:DUF262 domain-containing protein n=1 Tax=Skermanella cutis TaxID=2775420 RepID=A0ABX7B2Q9_9PROT|nr:DUF262 domain-containing protein [Skermanella sp. TT6]QQP88616.1 DUF262 domain-containing protein [Skermanella sp. TT6]